MEQTASATAPRCSVAAAVTMLLLVAAPSLAPGSVDETAPSPREVELAASWHWRQMPSPRGVRGEEGLTAVAALAVPTGGAWVAVGDAQGVALQPPGESFRFAARAEVVTDLHFGADAALWIASLNGLWHLAPGGRLEDRSPGPGEAARRVRRLSVSKGLIALATDAGAYVSHDGRSWERLSDGVPSAPAVSAALRVVPESSGGLKFEVWVVVGARLWRAEVAPSELGLRLLGAEVETIAGGPAGGEPVDVIADVSGADVVLLYPQTLALLRTGTLAESRGAGVRRWEVVRPVVAPGAVCRRISAAGGRLWLGTDRGLLEADTPAGPWRRSALPAGSTPSWNVVAADERLLVASQRGLLAASAASAVRAAPDPAEAVAARLAAEPEILEVQRAALRYLGLQAERVDELRRDLARRGWLPSVSLRLGAARDSEYRRDYDDSVVYGDRYALFDEQRERGDQLDASIVFTWDFADLAFNPDSVDLSREVRQVIGLRDDVLDEIAQLYFERKNVLIRLYAAPALGSASKGEGPASSGLEQLQLELRAQELTAGLDAWTGGWFSAHIRDTSRRFQVPSHELSPR